MDEKYAGIVTALAALVTALGGWYASKLTTKNKRAEIIPVELELVLSSWEKELARYIEQVHALTAERDNLKEKVRLLENIVEDLRRDIKILKEKLG